MNTWQERALIWGGRDAMAEVVNRTTHHPVPSLSATKQAMSQLKGFKPLTDTAKTLDYANVFRLGRETIPISQFNWQRFSNTAKDNYQKLLAGITSNQKFFRHVTAHSFVEKTVWGNNVNPIKELFSNKADKKIGSGIFRLFAFGILATDILKNTEQAYQKAKAKEDGSLGSKLHTWKETVLTGAKFTLRNLLSWEIGSVAFAFGRALLPVAIGGIPVLGIAVGALGSLLAQELVLDKVLGISKQQNPAKPPHNPFKAATI